MLEDRLNQKFSQIDKNLKEHDTCLKDFMSTSDKSVASLKEKIEDLKKYFDSVASQTKLL